MVKVGLGTEKMHYEMNQWIQGRKHVRCALFFWWSFGDYLREVLREYVGKKLICYVSAVKLLIEKEEFIIMSSIVEY